MYKSNHYHPYSAFVGVVTFLHALQLELDAKLSKQRQVQVRCTGILGPYLLSVPLCQCKILLLFLQGRGVGFPKVRDGCPLLGRFLLHSHYSIISILPDRGKVFQYTSFLKVSWGVTGRKDALSISLKR